MKYMFASDVHGSAYYCRKMLDAYKEEKAERLVLPVSYTHLTLPTICSV